MGIDIPVSLTPLTPLDDVLSVLVHGRPIESTLPDFGMSPECTIMASIFSSVALLNDLNGFFHMDTSSLHTILAGPIEVRVIPKLHLALLDQLLLIYPSGM